MQELHFDEGEWDKKKIAIGIAVVALVFGAIGYFARGATTGSRLFGKNTSESQVEGVSTTDAEQKQSPTIPSASTFVEERIEDLKKQAGSLDPAEITSSSPQVQKILQDLQSIQKLPKNQAKEVCEKVCQGIQ